MDLAVAKALFIWVTYLWLSTTRGNIENTTTVDGTNNSMSTVQTPMLSATKNLTHTTTKNLMHTTTNNLTHSIQPSVTSAYLPTSTMNTSSSSRQTSAMTSTPISKPAASSTLQGRDVTATRSSLRPSSPSPTQNTPGIPGNDDNSNNYMALLVALGTVAGVAAVVAIIFFVLYLRSSDSCYDRLRLRRSSPDSFPFQTVGNISSTSSPFRGRLASLSSIRRQAICKSEPFCILAFCEHVKKLHADSDYLFSVEYEAVGGKKYLNDTDKKLELTSNEGKHPNNKSKNRYSDILPYDHSRFVLSEIDGDPYSVYINANYVDSYRKPRAYVAAQGPLSASLADFWRMIWESNTRVVVMVTNLFERTKSKCVQYWPNKGSADYGFLRVAILKEEKYANYVIRTFSVEPTPKQLHYTKSECESRVIQQFQFTEWPDHDVPVHPVALLRFIRHSKSANPADAGPLIVHCSAGVGRSGAYIVIDSMMERIEDDKSVDIFNFLNHIRTQRVYLVQEESQYMFVHDSLVEHINFGDSNIPIREFHTHLQSLRAVNPDTKKNRIKVEFEDIDSTRTPDKHKWAGKKTFNITKNRRKDILPVERTRVKLPLVLGMEGADYINASFIDGFNKKREYIATQAPMIKTAECFFRMIRSTKCSTIVMLLDDEQWKKDDYADLPTEDEPVTCGRFEIHLESQNVMEKVTVRKLRLFSSETSDGHTVTHFHYRDWPCGGFPKDKISLINFIEQVRDHKMAESPDYPVTVHCDCGVGPTGVFCLVSALYDQIEREKCVDVFHAAKLLCAQRPKLIETEDQYSFCYEVLDQLVTRKLISMTTDSDNDEPSPPGTMGKKKSGSDSNLDVIANHSPELNGSVVVHKSSSHAGNENPKVVEKSPSAGKVSSSAGNVSPRVNKMNSNAGKKSPGEDKKTSAVRIAGNGIVNPGKSTPIGENHSSNANNEISNGTTKNADSDELGPSETEQANTGSSRQGLLSSSESSI